MDDHQTLIEEIEQFCRTRTIAESTFGRMAVNDGKFVGRLRSGKGVTTRTLKRVQEFMAAEDAFNQDFRDAGLFEMFGDSIHVGCPIKS